MMSATELYPILGSLSRYEKLLVMQFVVAELLAEASTDVLDPSIEYAIYSPLESYATAHAMQELLEQEKEQVIG